MYAIKLMIYLNDFGRTLINNFLSLLTLTAATYEVTSSKLQLT